MLVKKFIAGVLHAVTAAVLVLSPAAIAETTDALETGRKLAEKLQQLRPGIPIEAVVAIDIPGMYAIELSGGTTLYGTADGQHFFSGDLFAVQDDLVNLSEQRRDKKRQQLMAQQSLEDMIVFPAVGEPRGYIQVFTDVDCGYCRKLHNEMAQINELGIEVRYLAYPRAGVDSDTHDKMVSAWCAKDRQSAITQLKAGASVPTKTCQNAISDHYGLGQQLGISGTPAIVLADGRLLPGYLPAERLAAAVLGE
jgi:thiol:disulfide interchange protein DsbC|tara:strand:- start:183 stop:938 length:756 start_codon:yes stop_codon:yes gene_type:complete